jgi:hypothetical protein
MWFKKKEAPPIPPQKEKPLHSDEYNDLLNKLTMILGEYRVLEHKVLKLETKIARLKREETLNKLDQEEDLNTSFTPFL